VFQALQVPRPSEDIPSPLYATSYAMPTLAFRELLHKNQSVAIVDVRERPEYQKSHLSGAVNIPLDELESRANPELPRDVPVVVYCNHTTACEIKLHEKGVQSYCSLVLFMMHHLGYPSVQLVGDSLMTLKRAGFALVGNTPED
jgi:hypothetical protein